MGAVATVVNPTDPFDPGQPGAGDIGGDQPEDEVITEAKIIRWLLPGLDTVMFGSYDYIVGDEDTSFSFECLFTLLADGSTIPISGESTNENASLAPAILSNILETLSETSSTISSTLTSLAGQPVSGADILELDNFSLSVRLAALDGGSGQTVTAFSAQFITVDLDEVSSQAQSSGRTFETELGITLVHELLHAWAKREGLNESDFFGDNVEAILDDIAIEILDAIAETLANMESGHCS